MDGGRRRWSSIGSRLNLQSRMPSYDAGSATKIRPLDHTASNMQRGFESTITFTGKNDSGGTTSAYGTRFVKWRFARLIGRLGNIWGKVVWLYGCTCACQLGVFIFSRERLCIFIRMLSGGKTRFHGA